MELSRSIFNEVLEKVDVMPLEEQTLMIQILENRYREKRRDEILMNAQKSISEYQNGLTSKGSVADLMRELEGNQLPLLITKRMIYG